MKHLIALKLAILIGLSTTAQIDTEINFPQDFFGIYKGTLHINSEKGIREIPMEFHIQATDNAKQYTYTLVYGEGNTRQERNYTLKEEDKDKGKYIVDENNGIVLDNKVVNNRMYALFEVNNSLLTTFITFEKDQMVFEIVFASTANKNITFANNEERTEVISYPISTVQRAILIKQ